MCLAVASSTTRHIRCQRMVPYVTRSTLLRESACVRIQTPSKRGLETTDHTRIQQRTKRGHRGTTNLAKQGLTLSAQLLFQDSGAAYNLESQKTATKGIFVANKTTLIIFFLWGSFMMREGLDHALSNSHRFWRSPLFGMRHAVGILLFVLSISIRTASAGFIDMETPLNKRKTTSLVDGTTYHLVGFLENYSVYVTYSFNCSHAKLAFFSRSCPMSSMFRIALSRMATTRCGLLSTNPTTMRLRPVAVRFSFITRLQSLLPRMACSESRRF